MYVHVSHCNIFQSGPWQLPPSSPLPVYLRVRWEGAKELRIFSQAILLMRNYGCQKSECLVNCWADTLHSHRYHTQGYASESIHVNQCIWINTCESMHVIQLPSESIDLNHYMWINTSESMHLDQCIWINTCESAQSESMHLNQYIWINNSASIHLNR